MRGDLAPTNGCPPATVIPADARGPSCLPLQYHTAPVLQAGSAGRQIGRCLGDSDESLPTHAHPPSKVPPGHLHARDDCPRKGNRLPAPWRVLVRSLPSELIDGISVRYSFSTGVGAYACWYLSLWEPRYSSRTRQVLLWDARRNKNTIKNKDKHARVLVLFFVFFFSFPSYGRPSGQHQLWPGLTSSKLETRASRTSDMITVLTTTNERSRATRPDTRGAPTKSRTRISRETTLVCSTHRGTVACPAAHDHTILPFLAHTSKP